MSVRGDAPQLGRLGYAVPTMSGDQVELLARVRAGDREALARLLEPHLGLLRRFALRMVAQPDDAADLVQDTLLRAAEALPRFRGEAQVRTWLLRVLHNACVDHLRRRGRWRFDAQVHARVDPEADHDAVVAELRTMPADYDVTEHIAFCLSCVGRSLPPEQQAALVLRELSGLSNREAAEVAGVSESVLRHHLAAARRTMAAHFEGLCALVDKHGACWQCAALRDHVPAARRGRSLPVLAGDAEAMLDTRLALAHAADLEGGTAARLHALMFRSVAHTERRAR